MSAYLVLEGGDATGKSLQARKLVEWCSENGHQVCHLREPGSTRTGEALRELLLDPQTGALRPWTEALLFTAARSEMLRDEVEPALRRGEVVLVERCYLSTWVYQGLAAEAQAERVPMAALRQITAGAHGATWPDRIFVLDVDDEVRRRRRGGEAADRIEARGESFHRGVRQAYLQCAEEDERIVVVDANGSVDEVQVALRDMIAPLLEEAFG